MDNRGPSLRTSRIIERFVLFLVQPPLAVRLDRQPSSSSSAGNGVGPVEEAKTQINALEEMQHIVRGTVEHDVRTYVRTSLRENSTVPRYQENTTSIASNYFVSL